MDWKECGRKLTRTDLTYCQAILLERLKTTKLGLKHHGWNPNPGPSGSAAGGLCTSPRGKTMALLYMTPAIRGSAFWHFVFT